MKILGTHIVCTSAQFSVFNKVYECLRYGELNKHYFIEYYKGSEIQLEEISSDRFNELVSFKFPSELKKKKICPNLDENGNCPLHNLHCAYPDCEK